MRDVRSGGQQVGEAVRPVLLPVEEGVRGRVQETTHSEAEATRTRRPLQPPLQAGGAPWRRRARRGAAAGGGHDPGRRRCECRIEALLGARAGAWADGRAGGLAGGRSGGREGGRRQGGRQTEREEGMAGGDGERNEGSGR